MGIHNLYELVHDIVDEVSDIMADTQNSDEEDVKSALARTTQDGSGFTSVDELPASDFDSFAQSEVENNHDGDNEAAVEGAEVK